MKAVDVAAAATIVAICSVAFSVATCYGRNWERRSTENHHCAQAGGRLLRGQAEEFVCVQPKGVVWERKK